MSLAITGRPVELQFATLFLLVAQSLFFSEIADMAEPIARFSNRFDLKPFTFDEAKESIEMRLRVTGKRALRAIY